MGRLVLHWVCAFALVGLPVGGCGDGSTAAGGSGGSGDTGGGGGDGGMGGEAGSVGRVFPCTEAGILDAIAEAGGPHTFDCVGPTTVTTGAEIEIDNDVMLDGEGNLTVDGNDDHRVFSVARGMTVDLLGFTVSGGFAGSNPKAVSSGGGIRNNGTLKLSNSTVSGNRIDWGGGGGIDNRGVLTLTHTAVSENSVGSPVSDGGGILNSGTLTITNSTVSGNTSPFIDECTGSGISNWGMLTITNSTVSGPPDPPCLIRNAGTLTTKSSVVNGGCEGDIASGGYNIESPGDTCGFDQLSDQVDVSAEDLKLGELADNGGPTMTHALLPGSVAIDRIPATDCVDADGEPLTEDQRGLPRPETGGSMCDVGAFEVQPEP